MLLSSGSPLASSYQYCVNVRGIESNLLEKWHRTYILLFVRVTLCHLLKSVQSYSLKNQICCWGMSFSIWGLEYWQPSEALSWIRSGSYAPSLREWNNFCRLWPTVSAASVDFIMPAEFHFYFDSSELIDPYNQNAKKNQWIPESAAFPI